MVGQYKDAPVYINSRYPNKFDKTTGVEIRLAKGFADGVVSTQTIVAGIARNVMSESYTVALFVAFYSFSHGYNLTAYLVPQY
jgi:hypothetical protein